jgi:hypothetical protein
MNVSVFINRGLPPDPSVKQNSSVFFDELRVRGSDGKYELLSLLQQGVASGSEGEAELISVL